MSEQTAGVHIPQFHIGDRMEKALSDGDIGHQAMADYLGVSRNTVGNYIAQRSPVTVGVLRLWAMRTGVPLEWLRTGKVPVVGPPNPEECAIPDSDREPADLRHFASRLRFYPVAA